MPDLELLDVGDGRRLERFGDVVVDRPSPSAQGARRLPAAAWRGAALRWADDRWTRGGGHEPWPVRIGRLTLECRPAAGGQVGLFPEHARTWGWLEASVRAATSALGRPPEVLSLFAYTGGATLALAGAGARVAHVDASRPALAWARRNAERSGLAERHVRWLPDDARAFVRRERRRGRRYDGVVLDPPSYGHGTGSWRIDDDLPPLLDDLAALLGPTPALVLLTAHTPGYDPDRLGALVRDRLGVAVDVGRLELTSSAGALLRLGAYARSRAR
jgi:23S rRNA (cytosine1962-C5)-methyltransferase